MSVAPAHIDGDEVVLLLDQRSVDGRADREDKVTSFQTRIVGAWQTQYADSPRAMVALTLSLGLFLTWVSLRLTSGDLHSVVVVGRVALFLAAYVGAWAVLARVFQWLNSR